MHKITPDLFNQFLYTSFEVKEIRIGFEDSPSNCYLPFPICNPAMEIVEREVLARESQEHRRIQDLPHRIYSPIIIHAV
jgi:hypothetical protein